MVLGRDEREETLDYEDSAYPETGGIKPSFLSTMPRDGKKIWMLVLRILGTLPRDCGRQKGSYLSVKCRP